ncbi:sugar phosphate isomerase/epimerase [Thalassomonas sp. RHCl1]|uniref:sugar phosphate isomerase/epimerase family protein n=1 Tax=Thalassomonas sp. RHCl1 TaxID=2995320 RepID=UPI00248CDD5A|nr:sugar phosphate isomerase/epimerase [Thalassomonas sp. RHCl1]
MSLTRSENKMNLNKVINGFIALMLAGLLVTQAVHAESKINNQVNVGIQLWSVKDELKNDFVGTLTRLAEMGFNGVEFAGDFGPYGDNPQGLKKLLDKLGLKAAGAHLGFDQLSDDKIDQTIAFYKALDCRFLIVPWDERAFDPEGVYQVAKELSYVAGRLKSAGLKVGYHNHAEELQDFDNTTYWDILAKTTHPEVILQQDVGWTTYAGKDPVAYVHKYPGRTLTTHYKAKLPKGTQGKLPLIGQDVIPWDKLLKANLAVGGTLWFIVEQEEYPQGLSVMQSVAASLKGFEKVIAEAN